MTLRETLHDLGNDLRRLLFAGGATASSDAALSSRVRRLSRAKEVPALGELVERAGSIRGAAPRDAAEAMLRVAAMHAVVRRCLVTAVSVEGELAPLEPADPIDTPLSAAEVDALHRALTKRSGEGRAALVRDAVSRGRVRDLRLVPAWIDAVEDPTLGVLVTSEVLPLLGPTVAPALRARLRPDGGEVDARRLAALVAVLGARAREDVQRCLREGRPLVRAQALRCLQRIDPEAAAVEALERLRTETAGEVRAAAVATLATTDEAGVEAILEALEDADPRVQQSALDALASARDPRVDDHLLRVLQRALDEEALSDGRAETAVRVLRALGMRGAEAALHQGVLEHRHPKVRRAARDAAIAMRHRPSLEHLAMDLGSEDANRRRGAVRAVFALGREEAFDRLGEALSRAMKGPEGETLAAAVFEELLYDHVDDADPRWADRCLSWIGERAVQPWCVEYLASRKDPRAVGALASLLVDGTADRCTALDALGRLGDRSATAAVLDLLERDPRDPVRFWALLALEAMDDPGAASRLRALSAHEASDRAFAAQVDELVRRLERERAAG